MISRGSMGLNWLSNVFLVIMVAVIALNVRERIQSIDDYIEYLSVIPAKTEYEYGEKIKYYSFAVSHKPVNIEWFEEVWCAPTETGIFQSVPFHFKSQAESYFKGVRYSSEVIEILKKSYSNSIEAEYKLREYADVNLNPWILDIPEPPVGSTCVTRHTINIRTRYFEIKKETVLMSSPFIYGIGS